MLWEVDVFPRDPADDHVARALVAAAVELGFADCTSRYKPREKRPVPRRAGRKASEGVWSRQVESSEGRFVVRCPHPPSPPP